MGKIRKEDFTDLDIIDAVELASVAGVSDAYKTGVTVSTVTASTKRVVISGFNLLTERDTPVEPGDKVVIAGNAAAGTYTVAVVVSATSFDVVETIVDAVGGTVAFRYAAGAESVGIDTTRMAIVTANNGQDFLSDLDIGFLLTTEPPRPDTDYAATRTAGVITLEEWFRPDTTLLKEIEYTRSGGVITQEDRRVYGLDGTTVTGHLRLQYTRTGGVVTDATYVRLV